MRAIHELKIVVIWLILAHQKIFSCQGAPFGFIIVQIETISIFYDMLSTLTTIKRKLSLSSSP